jgi:hypothetical protein
MGGRQTIWRTGWRKKLDDRFSLRESKSWAGGDDQPVISLLSLIAFELRQIFLHQRDMLGIGGEFQRFAQLGRSGPSPFAM